MDDLKIKQGTVTTLADFMLETLPDSWAAQLRPEVEKILLSGEGDRVLLRAEEFVAAKCEEYSRIDGQPTLRYECGVALPVVESAAG